MSLDKAINRGSLLLKLSTLAEGEMVETLSPKEARAAALGLRKEIRSSREELCCFNPSDNLWEDNEQWSEYLATLMDAVCVLYAFMEGKHWAEFKILRRLVGDFSDELKAHHEDVCFVLDHCCLVQNWQKALGQRKYQFWWTDGTLQASREYARLATDISPFDFIERF